MAPLRNAKHEHFAQLIVNGKTPPVAYVTAGYSEAGAQQSAGRLLRDALVCSRIAHLRASIEAPARERAVEKAALDKTWVLTQLIENVKMAKAAEPVRDAEGNATGEYRQNLPAANKALELLGKELGMFIDRKEIRTGPLDGLPADEAQSLIEAIDAIHAARTAGNVGRPAGSTAVAGGQERR